MKKHILLISIFFCFSQAFSQFTYERYDSAQVAVNGKTLKFPFVGGMNAPQFSEIDLNLDGTMDLLVFDRSGDRVLTFINEGIQDSVSYIYKPEYESKIPFARDFLLAIDYNCDGKNDLFSRFYNEIIVYENTSTSSTGLSFSSIIRLTTDYDPFDGVPSPSGIYILSPNLPGIGDVDNDGDIDIIVPDQFGQMFNYHKNMSVETSSSCGLDFERRARCWGDITESNLNATLYLDSCRQADFPNSELSVKNLNFDENLSTNKNGSKHGNASITLYDLDQNGSMDMLLGDDGSSRVSALFNDDSTSPHTNSHIFRYDTLYPNFDQNIDLKLFPATYFLDVDNDSIEDMIVATNSTSRIANEFSKSRNNIHFYKGTGNPNAPFTFKRTDFLNRDFLDFGLRSATVFFDYNNDGKVDLLVGNEGYVDSTGNPVAQLVLFENTGSTNFPDYQLVDENYAQISSIPLNISANKPTTGLIPAMYDLDNDGDQDLIIGDYYGRLHYFKDTSSTNQNAAFALEAAALNKINVYNEAAPSLVDINGDSLADLVIGNESGRLQFHLNLGSLTNPIFGLAVQSVEWQSGNTVRYNLRNINANLNLLQVGQTIRVNEPLNLNNGVPQTISAINSAQNYIECSHPFRTDAMDDEFNSTGVIDYSIKDFGGINMAQNYMYSPAAVPYMINDSGKLYMLLATGDGEIHLYDSIANNLDGNFHLADTNYLGVQNIGKKLTISGADFNNDGKIDLVVGNQNGGINLFDAKFGVGLNENNASVNNKSSLFKLYPNPSNGEFTIELFNKSEENLLRIYSIKGQLIKEQLIDKNRVTYNRNELPNGIYFIELSNSKGRSVEKLVIQR